MFFPSLIEGIVISTSFIIPIVVLYNNDDGLYYDSNGLSSDRSTIKNQKSLRYNQRDSICGKGGIRTLGGFYTPAR